ncbi:MAPEG family protein [Maricaulis sp. CAU 1757]
MTALQAVALYAALNLLLFIFLGINVIRHRRRAGLPLGHGTDGQLEMACRAHGNAAENMAMALIGITILGFMGASVWLIHGLGLTLVIGRTLHAWGLLTRAGTSPGRFFGMGLTFLCLLGCAVALLWMALT